MDQTQYEIMKERFISLLQSTNREGVEHVLTYLEQVGFYKAPASINNHLNYDGGLLEHSLHVCEMALKLRELAISMRPEVELRLPKESVIIASLLHDTCKSNVYVKEKKWRKNEENKWEQYDSYGFDTSRLPVGHGEKSVIMLLKLGLNLTVDEIIAIRWHMGAWDLPFQSYDEKTNYNTAGETCQLLSIVQAADGLSTRILEGKFE